MVSLVFLCGGGCVFPLCVHCPCRALVLPYTWRRVGLVKSLPLISLVGSPRQTIKYSPGCSLEMGRNRIYGYALWIPFVIPQGYIYFIYIWNMVVFPELINNCWIKEKVTSSRSAQRMLSGNKRKRKMFFDSQLQCWVSPPDPRPSGEYTLHLWCCWAIPPEQSNNE